MPIKPAQAIAWGDSPRCPVCGVGIVPYGRNQPMAVDEHGRPYCRVHAAIVAPDYEVVLADYRLAREKLQRLYAFVSEGQAEPTVSELREAAAPWGQPHG